MYQIATNKKRIDGGCTRYKSSYTTWLTFARPNKRRTRASRKPQAKSRILLAEAAKSLKGLEDAQEKVVEVLKVGADLLDGTELKGIAESVKAHSQSISGVHSRVDALESKVTELISVAGALQNTVESGIKNLNEEIESVHVDVKTPIIVKLLF